MMERFPFPDDVVVAWHVIYTMVIKASDISIMLKLSLLLGATCQSQRAVRHQWIRSYIGDNLAILATR